MKEALPLIETVHLEEFGLPVDAQDLQATGPEIVEVAGADLIFCATYQP